MELISEQTRAPSRAITSGLLLSIAVLSLGYAVQISNGNLHPQSIFLLTVALVSTFGALLVPGLAPIERLGERVILVTLGIGFAFQLAQLLTTVPAMYIQRGTRERDVLFFAGLAAAAVVAGGIFSNSPVLGKLQLPALLAIHFLLGIWLIKASPMPQIDVLVFQRDSIAALLHGNNPYAITFPDIYGSSPFYGPGLSRAGKLQFGFPYPPLSLFLAMPGQLLAGDFRYSQLAAMTLSGGLMAYSRPGAVSPAAAAVFLFTPRVFFVLEEAWTEPFVVLLLALTVFLACRAPKFVPYGLGLFFAVKQYLLLVAPLVVLLIPREAQRRERIRWLAKVVVTAAVVTLPLMVVNVPKFVWNVLTLQVYQPFRTDALSYPSWWVAQGGQPITWIAFVVIIPTLVLVLWKAERGPAGFALGVALVLFVFFAFNKQAFCNYYYFVIGALCTTLAASGPPKRLPQNFAAETV
jgi:hypothetical protein